MGKAVEGLPEPASLTPSGEAESIGRYLARQRRLRGISLDELAAMTHIPRRSLERLEGGAFDAEPDGFARGFVRTVAGAIGLDPEDAVTRMLAEARPARSVERRLPAALVLLAVALALGVWLVASLPALRGDPAATEGAAPEPETATRRDHVRELAERPAEPAP